MYIAFNFLGKNLVLASWYACIDYVTFHRETPLRKTVCIPTIDMKRTLLFYNTEAMRMLILTHTQTVIDMMDDKKHHGIYK